MCLGAAAAVGVEGEDDGHEDQGGDGGGQHHHHHHEVGVEVVVHGVEQRPEVLGLVALLAAELAGAQQPVRVGGGDPGEVPHHHPAPVRDPVQVDVGHPVTHSY